MGPLGGIGDAIFWFTVLPIVAGIAASMAIEGSIVGPIIFLCNKLGIFSVDEKGLFTRTDLSKTASARAMFEEIQAGMYYQMSFAFVVREDSYDKETHTRKILKIDKLYDVSAVSFPANPGTDIGVATRDYFNGVIEMEQAERLAKEEALKQARAKYDSVRKKG